MRVIPSDHRYVQSCPLSKKFEDSTLSPGGWLPLDNVGDFSCLLSMPLLACAAIK
jgi:hypothetical protein